MKWTTRNTMRTQRWFAWHPVLIGDYLPGGGNTYVWWTWVIRCEEFSSTGARHYVYQEISK